MKTLKNTIENFANEALTSTEMNFVRGGGEPIDLIIPATKPDDYPTGSNKTNR